MIKYLHILLAITMCFGILSCSKEEDNEYHGDGAIGNISNVFPQGMIKNILRPTYPFISDITYDEQGRVTSMKMFDSGDKVDIKYPTSNTITFITYNYDIDTNGYTIPIETTFILGANGFIKSGVCYDWYGEKTWEMSYDKQDHLTSMIYTRKYGSENTICKSKMIYNTNGDITKQIIEHKSENSIYKYPYRNSGSTNFSYTNANVSKPIDNKGHIMLFQQSLLYKEVCLYYAGLLGKSTTHLPVDMKSTSTYYFSPENDTTRIDNKTMIWNLDQNGYPLSMHAKDSEDSTNDENYYFTW